MLFSLFCGNTWILLQCSMYIHCTPHTCKWKSPVFRNTENRTNSQNLGRKEKKNTEFHRKHKLLMPKMSKYGKYRTKRIKTNQNQQNKTLHAWNSWIKPVPSVYTGWPQKNWTVDFSGLCSDQQLSFFTLLDRASFPHYNNTKIIKFGWELFYFMSNFLWTVIIGICHSFVINRASELWKLCKSRKWQSIRNYS